MKLRSLQAFCAAVEEGSISGAARRMYLSQPSVSERISDLEREAGTRLLTRSRRGVEPTEVGRTLYEHARRVLDEAASLEGLMQGIRHSRERSLRVAASSTLGEHVLPGWLRSFAAESSEASPEVFVGNTREVVSLVKSEAVAFGIVEGREGFGSLDSTVLMADELVVVVRPDHRWSGRGVDAEDLASEPFISREKGSGTREVVERALAELGVSLKVSYEISSTSAIKESIEAGLGFSILSRETIHLELETHHLATAREPRIARNLVLIRNPASKLNTMEEHFLSYLMSTVHKADDTPDFPLP